jgi:hypothetical protein
MPDPTANKGLLTIGDVARRTGLAVSAIRYYDDEGSGLRAADAGRQADVHPLRHSVGCPSF